MDDTPQHLWIFKISRQVVIYKKKPQQIDVMLRIGFHCQAWIFLVPSWTLSLFDK
jgi:hypothetical protein